MITLNALNKDHGIESDLLVPIVALTPASKPDHNTQSALSEYGLITRKRKDSLRG